MKMKKILKATAGVLVVGIFLSIWKSYSPNTMYCGVIGCLIGFLLGSFKGSKLPAYYSAIKSAIIAVKEGTEQEIVSSAAENEKNIFETTNEEQFEDSPHAETEEMVAVIEGAGIVEEVSSEVPIVPEKENTFTEDTVKVDTDEETIPQIQEFEHENFCIDAEQLHKMFEERDEEEPEFSFDATVFTDEAVEKEEQTQTFDSLDALIKHVEQTA